MRRCQSSRPAADSSRRRDSPTARRSARSGAWFYGVIVDRQRGARGATLAEPFDAHRFFADFGAFAAWPSRFAEALMSRLSCSSSSASRRRVRLCTTIRFARSRIFWRSSGIGSQVSTLGVAPRNRLPSGSGLVGVDRGRHRRLYVQPSERHVETTLDRRREPKRGVWMACLRVAMTEPHRAFTVRTISAEAIRSLPHSKGENRPCQFCWEVGYGVDDGVRTRDFRSHSPALYR
jgi:hypothetical protein